MDVLHIHEAFKAGDLETLRSFADDPARFPNCRFPGVFCHCLEYAIYHSPVQFIRLLLTEGADPNYTDHAGFPSLVAALSTKREDRHQIMESLIAFGADLSQRGINDYTPLHYAAARNDPAAVDLLLSHGADASARTRIDDFSTPMEEAERLGASAAAARLKKGSR
jgi:uncharacterized protein